MYDGVSYQQITSPKFSVAAGRKKEMGNFHFSPDLSVFSVFLSRIIGKLKIN